MSDSPTSDLPAPDPSGPTVEPYQSEAVDRVRKMMDAAPTQIGRYRILEKLGGGGMGEVYRAEQRVPVRREVAIKLIKLGMDTKLVIARFEAERQALAMMDHPNIAKVHDADADETGRPYFVMEYVKGRPITEYADANHLTIPERLALFEQVCNAIQHAHHKGIIHRDLKPSNVLVSTQDGKPHAKVIDFGIAKATSQRLTDMTLYTQHDQFIGTPQYMSPEQADGSLDIDTRTDVYSLGVLLYELLTGSTPFAREEMKAAAVDKLKQMIREIDPPRPSTRLSMSGSTLPTLAASRRVEPKRLGALLRGELDWIVMKSLEKDRARRYGTPDSLAEDVRRYLGGEPVVAAPPAWTYRARKFIRKYRGPVIAAGAVGGTLIAGIAGTSALAIYAKRQQAIAVAEKARADAATLRETARAEEAEIDAYTANLTAAQAAISSNAWPEARRRLNATPERLRGFEWNFLRQQAGVFQYTLPGEFKQVVSHEQTLLTIADSPNTARLWDLASGRSIGQAMDHPNAITVAAFSPNGTQVMTGCRDGFARLWDASTGQLIGQPMKIGYSVDQATFNADGRRVLVMAGWGLAHIWDTQTTRPVGRPIMEGGQMSAAEFSPDGRFVQTLEGTGTLKLWNADDGQLLFRLPIKLGNTAGSIFTPDSRFCLLQGGAIQPSLWDTQTGDVHELSNLPLGKRPVAISPDSIRLAYLNENHEVRQLLLPGGQPTGPTIHCSLATADLEFTRDGQWIQVTDPASSVTRAWDAATGQPVSGPWQAGEYIAEAGAAGGRVLQRIDNKRFRLLDSAGRTLATVAGNDFLGTARWIDHDRALLFSTGPQSAFGGNPARYTVARVDDLNSPRVMLSADNDADIAVECALAGTPLAEMSAAKAFSLQAAPDGSIGVRSNDQPLATLVGHAPGPIASVFSPDGRRLVSAGEDRTLRFWDTHSWKPLAVFPIDGSVKRLRFSPDGTRLTIELADGSGEIWDTRPAADARQDLLAQAAEEAPAKQDVATLLAGNVPTAKLIDSVRQDTSCSPLRKRAILQQLRLAIDALQAKADAIVNAIPDDATWVARRAVSKAVADPRLAALVRSKTRASHGGTWDYVIASGNPVTDYQAIRDDLKDAIASDNENYNALAYVSYRLGEYDQTISLLNRPEAINPENRPLPVGDRRHMADWAFLAMAYHQLGQAVEAARCRDRFLQIYANTDDSRMKRYLNLRNELFALVGPTTKPK